MSGAIKFRLAAFILVIGGMVAVIVWTAQSAWRRGGELRDRLTAVQLASFQIADHFEQSILELNNLVLRYGVYHSTNDWKHFGVASENLDHWIDDQRDALRTEKEKHILDLINTNYDFYVAAARTIEANVRTNVKSSLPLVEFADFETKSSGLLKLGFQLADAHRESMDSFLAASNKALSYLRFLLVTALGFLLLAAGGLAIVVYGELIAPLRIKLVQNQALMERQEKLASLGMLAAGVAHEIRNPLTAIKAWLFIQRKQLHPGTPEYADAEIISNEITHLERIVKDVLLFAKPSEPHLAEVEAVAILRQVSSLLSPQLQKTKIRLSVQDTVDAKIRVDPHQIQQVLINLIQNAVESIGHTGTVTLRVRTGVRRLAQNHENVVILEVIDTGKGIPPEVEKRLFDPFFSTKEAGTGLGLSIAARIVQKHGGALQYQTQVDHGTTFGIVLPRAGKTN